LYGLLRTLLFRLSPETAHHIAMRSMSLAPAMVSMLAPSFTAPASLRQTLWNLSFAHPIGLAAGLDKDGIAVNGLLRCGFSFIEVGTVTPLPQPGNPQPRLFRLVEDDALVNRMGFNNRGATELMRNLMRRRRPGVIGVNIGKNKSTPNEQAVNDYVQLVDKLYRMADYLVVNVSSPNTPGLRDLQAEEALVPLIQAVKAARDRQYQAHLDKVVPHWVPVLVKLAPDLPDDALQSLASRLVEVGVDGFIATNTTIRRDGLTSPLQAEPGGLSGRPLRQRSTEVVSLLYEATRGAVPIVGCGGVFSAEDAYAKIRAGASLVQIYTSFIYKGPGVIKELVEGIDALLRADGFSSIAEAVGADHRA
jgi:dihydroorotate dehydrogenase